ncbi:decapping and exoribonuclease protein isoform X1 [Megalopta genalis]|uniref:decapping and exoribonuclease protein isoform X1 n=2 Tax=Megalopta genalis TaxID=115081 RepID=UPI003FD237CE
MFLYIHDLIDADGDFATPQIIGSYSINGDGEYCEDLSKLKYLKQSKKFPFNLDDTRGMITKSDKDVKISYLLRWITEHFDDLRNQNSNNATTKWLEADFVCYRGLLRTLLATPYDTEGWLICASKFKGTIYLCAYDTEAKKQRVLTETAYSKRCTLWGHKFEQYMVAASPTAEPDLSVPLNLNELFGGVFKSQLGNRVLLYAGEMDAIYSKEPILGTNTIKGKNIEFIELKTINKKFITRNGQMTNDQIAQRGEKLLRWFLQSHLVGIQRIICGCRDFKGVVNRIVELKIDKIREDSQKNWDFEICKKFAIGFIDRIREIVSLNYDNCMYQFIYEPGRNRINVVTSRPDPDPESEYTFLYSWYVNAARRHFENSEIAN